MASLPMNYPRYYVHILQFNANVTLVMVMKMVMITTQFFFFVFCFSNIEVLHLLSYADIQN